MKNTVDTEILGLQHQKTEAISSAMGPGPGKWVCNGHSLIVLEDTSRLPIQELLRLFGNLTQDKDRNEFTLVYDKSDLDLDSNEGPTTMISPPKLINI